ncbi:MAG TPA: hypothetical protein VJZ76_13230 [Thermoanaerobaculia bacterium]|nr:hypothetical protein [Thermoanaerobaculia bacterium]
MLSAEFRYAASAVLAAWALHVVSRETPVDHALPFVGVVVVFLAWRCGAAIEIAVPLLVVAAIALPDEHARLLAFGIIVAGAFAAAVPRTFLDATGVMVAAVLVLRWIPLSNVEVVRELIVLVGAFAVLLARPTSIVGAVAVALVTPTHPGKALLYPFLVAAIVFVARSVPAALGVIIASLAAAHFARAEHAPLWIAAAVAVAAPLLASYARVAVIALLLLWPWSGIVARAMPNFFWAKPAPRQVVGAALAASQSIDVSVPPGAKKIALLASGANVSRFKNGRVIGTVNGTPIRIGDVADFGFLRRDQFFFARNPLPRRPVADIRGYGHAAFLYGAGFVEVPPAETLHISAAPDLPPNARLQVESVGQE